MTRAGAGMAADIAEQPAGYARLLRGRARRGDRRGWPPRSPQRRPRHVVFTGPRHLRPRRALRGVPHRDPARPARRAGLAVARSPLYGARPDLRRRAGRRRSARAAARPTWPRCSGSPASTGALTLAVTNNPDSPLAEAAELHVDVAAGHGAGGRGHQDVHRRAARAAAAGRGHPGRRRRAARRRARRAGRAARAGRPDAGRRHRGQLAAAVPVRRPAGHHRPGVRLPDRPGGRAEADGDLVPAGAGVLRRRPAARPARDGRPGRAGARRGRRRARAAGRCATVLARLGERRADVVVVGAAERADGAAGGSPSRRSTSGTRRCWTSCRCSGSRWPWRWPAARTRTRRAG